MMKEKFEPITLKNKCTRHVFEINKAEFLPRLGMGGKYNGLKYDVSGYTDDDHVSITIYVPDKNKNGNYKKQLDI